MTRPAFQRAGAWVIGLMLVFALAVLAIATVLKETRRTEKLTQAQVQAQHFVTGAEVAVNRSLLSIDVLLANVDSMLSLSANPRTPLDRALADRLIHNTMRQNLLVSKLALLDARGNTLATSDRMDGAAALTLPTGFLEQALAPDSPVLAISAPVVSFQSSELVLYMGRTIHLSNNRRLLAVAEIPVAQLARVLVQGADIPWLQSTLERSNGQLLVATPNSGNLSDDLLTPPLASLEHLDQPLSMPARLGHEPAIVAVRKTLYGDLYITASLPVAAALSQWARDARLVNAVAAAMVVLILAAGSFAFWYLLRLGRAQASVARGKAVLDHALESMVSGFILLDGQKNVLTWNRRFVELHPWLADKIQPLIPFKTLVELTAEHTRAESSAIEREQWVLHRMAMLDEFHDARQVTSADGLMLEITERPTPDGGVVIVYQDVTRLRQAIADVEQLAFYDPLTNLPNRRLLNDRLQQGIIASLRTGRYGALLFLDLDHFKTLNDTSGHETGDLLLQQVAQRLKSCLRDNDTVARLGGDEFVVMLQNLNIDATEATAHARRVATTILTHLKLPYHLQGAEHTTSCSIGATLFGGQAQDASDLLKQADIAMYSVKNAGRNDVSFFDPKMLVALTARADMERDLRHALDDHQLELYYQIQVTQDARPVGAEVLLRWRHPELGMVMPGQFIGLAEDTGLILPIGAWVLRQACLRLKAWESQPAAARLQLAVNVSARQFRNTGFVQEVQSILRETGIQANRLKLELTESVVLDNIDDTIAKMQQLRAQGVRFSIDDFGTGYSSLAYLTRLPLDQLKIDRSFVRNIDLQASDSAVIDTIISLARSLNLEVIAEGVETVAQRDFLSRHGCVNWQGYLFGRPLPLDEFEARLPEPAMSV